MTIWWARWAKRQLALEGVVGAGGVQELQQLGDFDVAHVVAGPAGAVAEGPNAVRATTRTSQTGRCGPE